MAYFGKKEFFSGVLFWSALLGASFVAFFFYWLQPYDAQDDLVFVVDQILKNHPGPCNGLDPLFTQHLEDAAQLASHDLATASTFEEKRAVLNAFMRSFNDAHLRIDWKDGTSKLIRPPVEEERFDWRFIGDGVCWITVPTFQQLTSRQKQALQDICALLPQLRRASWVIFDLRGNGGGNSDYGRRLVEALFGKKYMAYCLEKQVALQSVDWRVSEDNLAHLRFLLPLVKGSSIESEVEKLIAAMADAIANGDVFVTQADQKSKKPRMMPLHPCVAARVACLVNRGTGSSSLDFIDMLKATGHRIFLAGSETSVDRLYMELRSVALPSGKGLFCHPIKVYRNRPRGDACGYTPDLRI